MVRAIQMEDEEAEAAQSDPEQLVEDFKQFLDEVRPEEFGEDG